MNHVDISSLESSEVFKLTCTTIGMQSLTKSTDQTKFHYTSPISAHYSLPEVGSLSSRIDVAHMITKSLKRCNEGSKGLGLFITSGHGRIHAIDF